MSTVRLSDLIAPALQPVHRALRDQSYDEIWLSGGRGSGKSSFVALEILLGMIRHPDANALILRRVGATLRESVFEQMLWAVDRLGLNKEYRPKLSPPEIENLRTGQRILFRGADDPGKTKSLKLSRGVFGYLWFEEMSEFSALTDILTVRASAFRGSADFRPVTFCTYNPPADAAHWVNQSAAELMQGRFTHYSTYLDMPEGWLGESFIAEAERQKTARPLLYRQMYLGEVTGIGDEVFDNLRIAVPDRDDLAAVAYCGLDFGFAADPDAFVRATYDPRRRRLCITDEFVATRVPADELTRIIRSRAKGDIVRCDGADPRLIDALRRGGVKAVAAKKGPGSVKQGIRWLQEQAEIVIDPVRCPVARRELVNARYRRDNEGNVIPEIPDRDNHTIDALRYALGPVIRAKAARTSQNPLF
ncbi:MAG: PBSX family phage terminase large subunit [Clostridia bacterium]|nr:PBSX family phage terminase large subunit [Clostridia bacterium]